MTGGKSKAGRPSDAQMARLWRLSVGGEYHVDGRPEVRALKRRGLAETNGFGCTVITPEGLALLAELKEKRRGG